MCFDLELIRARLRYGLALIVALITKYRAEVSALMQHADDFDGGIGYPIENRVRVNQNCPESGHHVISGPP